MARAELADEGNVKRNAHGVWQQRLYRDEAVGDAVATALSTSFPRCSAVARGCGRYRRATTSPRGRRGEGLGEVDRTGAIAPKTRGGVGKILTGERRKILKRSPRLGF